MASTTTSKVTKVSGGSGKRSGRKTMENYSVDGDHPAHRNVLIVPAHHMFAAILTKTLLRSGGALPFQCYRFGPKAPLDNAGGIYVRGGTTEKQTIDKILVKANIHIVVHLLLRNSGSLESQDIDESDVYNENVRDTNALLEALTRRSKTSKSKIKTILVSGVRSSIIDDVLGNTLRAAEALWLGKAIRQEWNSVILRSACSESPWDCGAFITFCYNIWDLGLHPYDLADALTIMVKHMTDDEEVYPKILRSTIWELKNRNQGLKNGPSTRERTVMEKYGFLLSEVYDSDVEEVGGKKEKSTKKSRDGFSDVAVESKIGRSTCAIEGGRDNDNVNEFIEAKKNMLGNWQPQYGKRQVLEDLSTFGYKGPPKPEWLIQMGSNTFSNNDGISVVHYGNYD